MQLIWNDKSYIRKINNKDMPLEETIKYCYKYA